MDFIFRVRELPSWKQAVQANEFYMFPGGKGLNQAVAAARLGAEVSMISAIGEDTFGEDIRTLLEREGVAHDRVLQVQDARTPVTCVFVNFEGEAAFIGWLNQQKIPLEKSHVSNVEETIEAADALLITLEASLVAVAEAVRIAKKYGKLVILNPAPPLELPQRLSHMLLQDVDWLVPNTWEASRILGEESEDSKAAELADRLSQHGPKKVCVTTSELGCVVAQGGKLKEYPAFPSSPVDTTGGSDAFCAALAIALASITNEEKAVTRANAAGAIAVGSIGGSPSMPTAKGVDRFLQSRKRSTSSG